MISCGTPPRCTPRFISLKTHWTALGVPDAASAPRNLGKPISIGERLERQVALSAAIRDRMSREEQLASGLDERVGYVYFDGSQNGGEWNEIIEIVGSDVGVLRSDTELEAFGPGPYARYQLDEQLGSPRALRSFM